MKLTHSTLAAAICGALCAAAQQAPDSPKCEGIPPGRHAQLERMTAAMKLTCEQQLKIEPLLHDEESVTQPLLRFQSFSDDQRAEVMTKIKIAARRQIKSQLTPEQQSWMDQDIESVSKGGKSGGGKKGAKGAAPGADPLADEEALSKAVMAYSALLPDEKKAIVLQVKKAARNDDRLPLTPEQQKKLDLEILDLSR
jgi:Spy/CpxP family protein refolding chaperone